MNEIYKNKLINNTLYEFNTLRQTIELVSIAIISFFTPFILNNQIIVGTIINFLLFRSSFYLKLKKSIIISIIPSLAVYIHGKMFGVLTKQMIYLIPFIILGNISLIIISRRFFIRKNKHIVKSMIHASIIKLAIIFIGILIMYLLGIISIFFIKIMFIIQIITISSAGIIFYIKYRINKNILKKTIL